MPVNPFDAADLADFYQVQHILQWYKRLSPSLRQRLVDTVINRQALWEMLGQAWQHQEHSIGDFDPDILLDLQRRLEINESR